MMAFHSDKSLNALLRIAVEKHFAEGDVLFVAGSSARGLYVVMEGRVRVLRGGGNGRAHVIHEEGPGGTLGEVPVFEGGTYPATAVAAAQTRCMFITREAVRSAVESDPDLALALLARLASRVRGLVDQLDQRTSRGIRERLASLLLQRSPEGSMAFTLGGTQHAIAESLGTVRELVVRGLRELRDDGVIEAAGKGRYIVIDRKRLSMIATQEKEYRGVGSER